MNLKWNGLALATLMITSILAASDIPMGAPPAGTVEISASNLSWHEDYAVAYNEAKEQKKQLLIVFRNDEMKEFEQKALNSEQLLPLLNKVVRVKIPLDATVVVADSKEEQPQKLLDLPAFSQMYKKPGFALIDLTDEKTPYYAQVVSSHPLHTVYRTDADLLQTVLQLPNGTATQRALVLAVRTHPEVPQSTTGAAAPFLMDQARYHSQLMVNYGSVGHHDWGTRSAEISARLGSPSEVASMGSSENILEAAREALDLWRGSGVHWGMVVSPHQYFGYDMVRSPGGGWYATGVFAN